jgi:SPW repeat-containing protein
MKGVSWVNLILGIWLLVAPVVLHTSGRPAMSSLASGLILIVIAALSLRTSASNHLPAWINLAVGFWVFFSPWALHLTDDTSVMVKSALTGPLIMIFALARSSAGRPASV